MRQDDHLSALHPGARLQTYTIASILGAGGFGITYKAVEDITNRDVAIKEYLPAAFALRDPDGTTVRPLSEGSARDFNWGLERFRDEAKLLIGFRHPNIVPVLAYFEANGTGYIVMAFQEGVSLGDALKRTPTISEAETLRYIVPLLDGVEEVHRHNVLHRDIKPDNIFISGDGAPVLLDFGAARQALGEHSKAFTTLVTEGFAPFEQYAGTGNQGPWSDIYALAAVMFRCLTGKSPVEAPRRAIAKLRGMPDPMAQDFADLRACVSPDLAFAIEAAMRVVEHERPQSIAAFREMIVAPAPSVVPLPAEGAAAAAPAPTLIPDAAFRVQAGAQYPPPGAARKPRRLVYVGAAGVLLAALAGAAAYVGDERTWLPGSFRRAESEAAKPEPAKVQMPPADEASRAAEEKRRAEERAAEEQRAKGYAEYQRLQIEQTEAEWRQYFEARKAAARKPDEPGAAPGKPSPGGEAARRESDRERPGEEAKKRNAARPPQRAPDTREDEEQRRVDEEHAPAETGREPAPDAPPRRAQPGDGHTLPPPEPPSRAPHGRRDPYYETDY